MPGTSANLTLAKVVQNKDATGIPSTLASGIICDALGKCIDDAALGWPSAIAAAAAAAGVVNPVTLAGILGLAAAMGIRRVLNDKQKARALQASLRREAAEQATVRDILHNLNDRTLTVGLDTLALQDIQELVTQAIQNHAPRVNDTLEAAFNQDLDELPPGPLHDELQNLRIFAQDTNTVVHQNAGGIAELLEYARREKLSDEELRRQIRAEVEREFADKYANEPDPDEGADRAAQAVVDVSDTPGIKDALREKGGQAIVEALLDKQTGPAADVVETHRKIAEWAYLIGNIDQAFASVNIILAHLPDDLDAINRLGHIHRLRGDLDDAQHQYERLLEIAPNDQRCRATALCSLGIIAMTQGDLDKADSIFHEALEINHKLRNLEGQSDNLISLGDIAFTHGDLSRAEKLYSEALEIDRNLRNLKRQSANLSNLGGIAFTRGDLSRAEKLYSEALEISWNLNDLEGEAVQLGNLGLIAQASDNLDNAKRLHSKSLEINMKLGRIEGQANQLGNLGNIAREQGNWHEAEKLYNKNIEIVRQLGSPVIESITLGNLGLIAKNQGDFDRANKLYRESLKINRNIGRRVGQAHQLFNLGVVAQIRGHLDDARKLWTESRDLHAKIGTAPWVDKIEGLLNSLPPS